MNTNNLVYHIFAYLRKIGMHRVDIQDPRIQEMHRTIQALERSAIKFEVKSNPDGGWDGQKHEILQASLLVAIKPVKWKAI